MNITQYETLMNSLHGMLNFEIGRLIVM